MRPTKQPQFPVNVLPSTNSIHEMLSAASSTTNSHYDSPTSSLNMLGRKSPNHELQMDPIAETDSTNATPTEITPPINVISNAISDIPGLRVIHNGQLSFGGGGGGGGRGGDPLQSGGQNFRRPVTPVDEQKQRRSGIDNLQCPVSPQMISEALHKVEMEDAKRAISPVVQQNSILHQMMSAPSPPAPAPTTATTATKVAQLGSNPPAIGLRNMLQSPLYDTNYQAMPPHPGINGYSVPVHPSSSSPSSSSMSYPQNNMDMPMYLQMPQLSSNQIDVVLSHISAVLNTIGLPFNYYHQSNTFNVEHSGVHFQIQVANNIHLQYIAGDTTQYQSMCNQLVSRLIPMI